MLELYHESKIDWKTTSDLLCCTPSFHHRPHYDCVLICTVKKVMFAWILAMFTCTFTGHTFPIALIHAYGTHINCIPKKDKDLGLLHVQPCLRAQAEFISIENLCLRGHLVTRLHKVRGGLQLLRVWSTWQGYVSMCLRHGCSYLIYCTLSGHGMICGTRHYRTW